MSLDKIKAKLLKAPQKRKASATPNKQGERICYPWLRITYARQAKAYMAHLVDLEKSIQNMSSSDKGKKKYFETNIYPRILERFPLLYSKIKKYYNNRGKKLSKAHFFLLLYARLTNMYENGFIERTQEHPLNSDCKELRKDYQKFTSK